MKKLISILLALAMILMLIPATVISAADGISGFKAVTGDKKVTLSWDAVSGAKSYSVMWGRSGSKLKEIAKVKSKSVTVSKLKNDTDYDFVIRADSGAETPLLTVTPSASGVKTVYAAEPVKAEPEHFESAADAVKNMGVGWNLGNTLDSYGSWLGSNSSVKAYETAWGNPQATEDLIKAVKKAGFGAMRVPVTWRMTIDSKGNVRKDWMDRVQEVVDWVLENDMYCIINIHHDTGSDGWIRASESGYKSAEKKFTRIWEQIAERFKDYGEKLVFECMNETLNDASDWNATDSASAKYIKKYQQTFVNVVRKSGGNNAERNLIVSPYAASANTTIINAFTLPDDTVEDHMIMEIHSYDPQGFTWKDATWTTMRDTWGTDADKRDMENFISTVAKKAKSLGVPVIIGEFGSMNKNNDKQRASHAAYFVKTAKKSGITVFWWDDGGEYTIIDRKTAKVTKQSIVDALVDSSLG